MAEWQNGGMVEWWNGGMAEWHNVRYEIVRNQDTESTQMPPWQSPSWLVYGNNTSNSITTSAKNSARKTKIGSNLKKLGLN